MRPLCTASCLGLLLCGCGSAPTVQPKTDPVVSGPRHPVTPKMKGVTDKLAAVKAPDFEAPTLDNESVSLKELLMNGPVVLYSILDGCPCSTDFEPLANSLAKRYGAKATVVGVYTDKLEKADKWAQAHSSDHPILIDTDLKIVKSYKQERSVYVVVVGKDGKILHSWPGYSADMLIDLDSIVQTDAGLALKPLDTAYAPKELSSGCQIFEGEGFASGDKR